MVTTARREAAQVVFLKLIRNITLERIFKWLSSLPEDGFAALHWISSESKKNCLKSARKAWVQKEADCDPPDSLTALTISRMQFTSTLVFTQNICSAWRGGKYIHSRMFLGTIYASIVPDFRGTYCTFISNYFSASWIIFLQINE